MKVSDLSASLRPQKSRIWPDHSFRLCCNSNELKEIYTPILLQKSLATKLILLLSIGFIGESYAYTGLGTVRWCRRFSSAPWNQNTKLHISNAVSIFLNCRLIPMHIKWIAQARICVNSIQSPCPIGGRNISLQWMRISGQMIFVENALRLPEKPVP